MYNKDEHNDWEEEYKGEENPFACYTLPIVLGMIAVIIVALIF